MQINIHFKYSNLTERTKSMGRAQRTILCNCANMTQASKSTDCKHQGGTLMETINLVNTNQLTTMIALLSHIGCSQRGCCIYYEIKVYGNTSVFLKTVLRNLGIVAYTFHLSTPETEAGISLSLRSAWSTQ